MQLRDRCFWFFWLLSSAHSFSSHGANRNTEAFLGLRPAYGWLWCSKATFTELHFFLSWLFFFYHGYFWGSEPTRLLHSWHPALWQPSEALINKNRAVLKQIQSWGWGELFWNTEMEKKFSKYELQKQRCHMGDTQHDFFCWFPPLRKVQGEERRGPLGKVAF